MTEWCTNNLEFNVVDIVRGTVVDGPGFRTSIYLAGCAHHCKGCHNSHTWDPDAGKKMLLKEILQIVEEEDFDVTISGGDPFFNPVKLRCLTQEIKNRGYNVWVYTGFTIEEIEEDAEMRKCLEFIDVIVDGKYVEELRDPDLRFRGSSNQRILPLKPAF